MTRQEAIDLAKEILNELDKLDLIFDEAFGTEETNDL